MSRKRHPRESRVPEREDDVRDTSPSGLSHSSTTAALEWDPSADVGAQVPTNTPIHQPKRRDVHPEDLSALDQIVLALNYGYDLRPYVTESRSRRFGKESKSKNPQSKRSDNNSQSNHSDGSNSSYRTATETEQDPVEPANTSTGVTSVSSDWQTSGLTRSEIEYRSKKDASRSGSQDSSSLLWVEVNAEVGSSSKSTSGENGDASLSERKSIGIQASFKTPGKESATSTKPQKHLKTQSTQVKVGGNSKSRPSPVNNPCKTEAHEHRVGCCTISIPSTSANHCQQYYVPMQCHCHAVSVQGSGSGRSLGSNPRYGDVSSGGGSNSNGSDVTPTCATLERLINEDVATLQNYGYEALEHHRSSLVRKIRKEFQHLERLNKMLMNKKKLPHTSISSLEPSSSSDSKNEDRKNSRSRLPPPPPPKSSSSDSKTTSKTDNMYVKTTRQSQGEPKPLKATNESKKAKDASKENIEKPKPVCYFVPYEYTPIYKQSRPSNPNLNDQQFNGKGQSTSRQRRDQGWYDESSKENQRPADERIPQYPDQQYSDSQSEYVIFENDMVQISLQQAFQQYRPNVLANVQAREHIVKNLKSEREARAEVERNYFRQRQNLLSPNESLNQALPENGPRIMSTKKMKELTEKKMKKLPEIREKEVVRRYEEDKKTNRILSQVFSRKLRQHCLKGDVNIVHSKTLIRH